MRDQGNISDNRYCPMPFLWFPVPEAFMAKRPSLSSSKAAGRADLDEHLRRRVSILLEQLEVGYHRAEDE